MMTCQNCNKESHQIHGWLENGIYKEVCAECGGLASIDAGVPDVFWNGRPYYSEALDCEFTSRSQKARVMKERNVSELGNERVPMKSWTEGSREYRKRMFDQIDRPKIRETYKRYLERVKK